MVARPENGRPDPAEMIRGINQIINERQLAIAEEFKRRREEAESERDADTGDTAGDGGSIGPEPEPGRSE